MEKEDLSNWAIHFSKIISLESDKHKCWHQHFFEKEGKDNILNRFP